MVLEVEVFLHGVPLGFKMLGDEQDRTYLLSFYNQNDWDVPEFLKVERVGNKMFYTFIKCNNVNDKNGRSGSYVGLTLRMNCFYADVQNVYSILHAAYKKLCVGVFVSDTGVKTQYLVSDFKEVGTKFDDIKKRILDIVGSLTISTDLLEINQVSDKNAGTQCINLMECAEDVTKQIFAGTNSLKVSTFYDSTKARNLRREYDNKINQAQKQHSVDLKNCQAKYEGEIANLRKQLTQRENDLQSSKNSLKKECERLTKELACSKEAKNVADSKLTQERVNKERILASLNDIIKQSGVNINTLPTNRVEPRKPVNNGIDRPQKVQEPNKKSKSKLYLRIFLFLLVLIFLFVTIVLIGRQGNQIHDLSNQIDTISTKLCTVVDKIQQGNTSGAEDRDQPIKNIDFDPISKGAIPRNKEIKLSIILNNKGTDANIMNGTFDTDVHDGVKIKKKGQGKASLTVDNDFNGQQITVKYSLNGQTIYERTVKVKE